MKVNYISDLHLGRFYSNNILLDYINENPNVENADVLVVAGDTSNISSLLNYNDADKTYLKSFINWCDKNFKLTIIIPGNHEYYDGTDLSLSMNNFKSYLTDKVVLANNTIINLEDVYFICSTMWSDVPVDKELYVNSYMNDTRLIKINGSQYKASDFKLVHAECVSFIEGALKELKCNHIPNEKVVVVTHHCPSIKCENPIHTGDMLSEAFISPEVEKNIITKYQPAFWIYGHTHYNKDVECGNTKIVSNQLGYYSNESISFEFGKFFEI